MFLEKKILDSFKLDIVLTETTRLLFRPVWTLTLLHGLQLLLVSDYMD